MVRVVMRARELGNLNLKSRSSPRAPGPGLLEHPARTSPSSWLPYIRESWKMAPDACPALRDGPAHPLEHQGLNAESLY